MIDITMFIILMVIAGILLLYSIYGNIFQLPAAVLSLFITWLMTVFMNAGLIVKSAFVPVNITETTATSGAVLKTIEYQTLTSSFIEPSLGYLMIFIALLVTVFVIYLFVGYYATIIKGGNPEEDEGGEY